VNGVEQGWFDQVFWACLATVAYLPATVFPAGLSRDGLPIGLQAIGAEFADRTTIELARLLANELGGFVPPPGFAD
jgi:amidase